MDEIKDKLIKNIKELRNLREEFRKRQDELKIKIEILKNRCDNETDEKLKNTIKYAIRRYSEMIKEYENMEENIKTEMERSIMIFPLF